MTSYEQPGAVIVHCFYAIYHLSRDAAGRTPTSSAAYQIFASVVDLCTIGLYTYSAYTVNSDSDEWTTRLANQDLLKYFVPAVYYTLIGSGGLHLISLVCGLWLSWAFRRISLMPPDMNPLEDNLTARPMHKKNRSSVTTASSAGNEKRASALSDKSIRSGQSSESISSPPTVPFMHTRQGSRDSFAMNRSTRDLPTRQYQVEHRNSVPNMSQPAVATSPQSRPVSYRGAYEQVPLSDSSSSIYPDEAPYDSAEPSRKPKFTETWAPTDSLISRTNQRNRSSAPPAQVHAETYTALTQQYVDDDSDVDDGEMATKQPHERDLAQSLRPHPLRLNPPATAPTEEPTKNQRAKTPFYPMGQGRQAGQNPLGEIKANSQHIDSSQDITDITDEIQQPSGKDRRPRRHHPVQTEIGFYSKPYGDLKSATPPIIVGTDRKVSSGNDYDARYSAVPYGRRNVSGKAAEEGRAGGNKLSRYGFGQYVGKNY